MAGGPVAVACLLAAASLLVEADHKIMTDVTLGFGQALEHCRAESGLTEEQMEEFFHVWNADFKFVDRELGCALHCMSRHFNLINDSNRLHHENTDKFIKSFPNGEKLAELLMNIVRECDHRFAHKEDECMRTLHVGECIRDTCLQRSLAPSMEMLLAEFIMQSEA
uniref:General odorant binding protein n=1 Tax=Glyphodes pyloalis TaxID=1242752 RepID=A0A6M3GU81_GLYPY|nr:general odorant binding protein [Glyphodes pyloalis]